MYYKKLGPFVTQVFENHILLYNSRVLRKSLKSPTVISWWIATLFMVGSFCFAFASVLSLSFTQFFSQFQINIIYFVGSIFFTVAAYLQFLESINADITHPPHAKSKTCSWYWLRWRPRNLGFDASLTQLIGTLFFNINTIDQLISGMSVELENMLIWTPDMLGSVLFLASSFFAYLEIHHDKSIRVFFSNTWWIVWANIIGSIFFQISAYYAWFPAQGQDPTASFIAIITTFLGAICFFVGAYLLRFEKL